MTSENNGKKASRKKLPIHRFVIICIVAFLTVVADVMLFCYMVAAPLEELSNGSHSILYDKYPEYSGIVIQIEARGEDPFKKAVIRDDSGNVIPVVYVDRINDGPFESVDSVEIGESCDWRSPKEAYITISNEDGEKCFYANSSTHVYDSISDTNGLALIETGKEVTFAYGQKDGIDDCDYVYAVKGSAPLYMYCLIIGAYILCVLISSLIAAGIIMVIFALLDLLIFPIMRRIIIVVAIAIVILCFVLYFSIGNYLNTAKAEASSITAHAPIIYLYNDSDELIDVKLDLDGELTVTYPEYPIGEGWTVSAAPDGTLTDIQGQEYPFLFWEAELNMDYDLSKGFCVKGSDTEEFLNEVLPELGLNETEMEDFEAYWVPLMENNPYNVITFQTTAYTDAAKLDVTPEPDVVIRVNMLWYASDDFVDIEPQALEDMNPSLEDRDGFVLVEWGGEIVTADICHE